MLNGRGELAAVLGLQGPDRFGALERARALEPLLERAGASPLPSPSSLGAAA